MSSYDPMYDLALAIQYEIMRLKSNIVLIGFMGSGKSITGKLLAYRLGYSFVDTDNINLINNQRAIYSNYILSNIGMYDNDAYNID